MAHEAEALGLSRSLGPEKGERLQRRGAQGVAGKRDVPGLHVMTAMGPRT